MDDLHFRRELRTDKGESQVADSGVGGWKQPIVQAIVSEPEWVRD